MSDDANLTLRMSAGAEDVPGYYGGVFQVYVVYVCVLLRAYRKMSMSQQVVASLLHPVDFVSSAPQ